MSIGQENIDYMNKYGVMPSLRGLESAMPDRLAGGGIKGGQYYGATDRDGFEVADNPVSEADYLATIYQAMGIDYRAKHYLGTRPIWATEEGAKPIAELLG